MADIIDIDSPFTRLRRECNEQIAAKDLLIEHLTTLVASAAEQVMAVRAVRDMLDLLLLDFEGQIDTIVAPMKEMSRNLASLRSKLPNLD